MSVNHNHLRLTQAVIDACQQLRAAGTDLFMPEV